VNRDSLRRAIVQFDNPRSLDGNHGLALHAAFAVENGSGPNAHSARYDAGSSIAVINLPGVRNNHCREGPNAGLVLIYLSMLIG